ncbi:hypothetical protein Tco_0638017 [Tanacetum coccineum]
MHSESVHEHTNHTKIKTAINTSDYDQIDSSIIFDDSYVENNGGEDEHDSNAHGQSVALESLLYNVQKEAKNNELEAEILGEEAKLTGYNFFNWSSDWGRILLGVSGLSCQLKFYGSFGLQVHLGFHLLMMVLGASGSPPCGCVVNP